MRSDWMRGVWLVVLLAAGANGIYASLILERFPFSEWKPKGAAAGWVSSICMSIALAAAACALLAGCVPIDPACVIRQGSDQPAYCRRN